MIRSRSRTRPSPILLSLLLAAGGLGGSPLWAEGDDPPDAATAAFPERSLFPPLLADPKQPRFFGALESARPFGAQEALTIGSIGLGEEFAFWGQRHGANAWQVGVAAGVFAQFELDGAQSYPLLNADYVLGIPLTWRHRAYALRLRFVHSSSHLGDELLLLNEHIERMNLSSEELELLVAKDVAGGRGTGRVYAGGGVLLHRRPTTLARRRLQCGVEWRGHAYTWVEAPSPRSVSVAPFAALDVKMLAEQAWVTDVHALGGIEIQRHGTRRRVRLFADYYSGFVPYGQFFHQRATSGGLGLDLAF